MNTHFEEHEWNISVEELEDMYQEYCEHESQIWHDLGIYREDYEKRLASLTKSYQAALACAQDDLYRKYKELNEKYQEREEESLRRAA